MKLKYDFHLHSCLSPCGDNDMTPYNLVNMAKLMGYDIIALTDHNSCLNCPAAIKAGEQAGITVVPGMELCTAEEIHTVCLFPTLEKALEFSEYVKTTMPPIKNDESIFGNQFIMDHLDGILGSEEILLTTASGISIDDVVREVARFDGVVFPAHLDRASYSVLSVLGFMYPEMNFTTAEFMPAVGYAPWFMGKVVDMFYFPLVEWNWPSWLPYIGGEHFIFFSPIFNFADACISCSVIYMLLFYRKQLQNIMK